jgi:hypothetical protein
VMQDKLPNFSIIQFLHLKMKEVSWLYWSLLSQQFYFPGLFSSRQEALGSISVPHRQNLCYLVSPYVAISQYLFLIHF